MLALGLSAIAACNAHAQAWPSKPLHVIIGTTPGNAVDVIPRTVFAQLSPELGQPIVVENRPGAGATIGAAAVARAAPDGHTILVASSAHTFAPAAYSNLSYDTVRDFSAVLPLGSLPNVLVVSPARGIKALRDFVAAGKAKSGAFTFGSAGVGSATHLSAERLRLSAGLDALHIPFRGIPEAYTEIIAGRVDFAFGAITSALPLIQDGRLVPLAVSTTTRSSLLPNVPTTLEAGYPDSDYTFWVGMFVPAKTPRDVVDRLHRDTSRVLQSAAMRDKLATLGVDPMVKTPSEFEAFIKDEIAVNVNFVKAAKLKLE
jgi:tripartite-type tricarboxylate transporter receptor subunit TctC